MSSGPFAWTSPPPAPGASVAELLSQVRELSQAIESTSNSPDLRKRSDLREHAVVPRRRRELTDPAERMKKLGLETGFDTRAGRFLAAPLEPWTGPPGSMELYARIMRGQAPATLPEYGGADLICLEYLVSEELVTVARPSAGQPHALMALSDGRAAVGRKYPGAPVGDRQAAIGRQLRGNLEEMVTSAVLWTSEGKALQRGRLRLARPRGRAGDGEGVPITGAQITAQVNAEKARRRDLDGYRFASVSRVQDILRKVLKKLAELFQVEEVAAPRAVRENRSWRTLARRVRRLTADPVESVTPG